MAISKVQIELALLYLKRIGWMLMMVALPFSNVLMSIATIWLGAIVLLEKIFWWKKFPGKTWYKHFAIPNNHSVWLMAIYALSVLGLWYTEDMKHGAWDLRMKLPLLVWPLIAAWIRPLSQEHKKQVWGVFIVALSLAVFICCGVYLRIFGKDWHDVRETSIFISHIRFGLMLALGVAVVWRYAFDKGVKGRLLLVLVVVLFAGYLIAIESLTGVLLIVVVVVWHALFEMRKWSSVPARRAMLIGVFTLPLLGFVYVLKEASIYFEEPNPTLSMLPAHSVNGEKYLSNIENTMAIKGEYIYGQIAPMELESAWKQRTGLSIYDPMDNGFPVMATMVRYMSALHLPKDSLGVSKLSDDDVKAVLKGYRSPGQERENGLERLLEALFFELAHYKAGGDPSGHSITQRWEFWRAAKYIIAHNAWLGVGTGDTKIAFAHAYKEINSTLLPERRLRAHNQYLTQWLTFGVAGLLVLSGALFMAWRNGQWRQPLWSSFLLIAALSFLTEDTLESQAGVTFFAVFYVWIKDAVKR